jgi:hypothetical protein
MIIRYESPKDPVLLRQAFVFVRRTHPGRVGAGGAPNLFRVPTRMRPVFDISVFPAGQVGGHRNEEGQPAYMLRMGSSNLLKVCEYAPIVPVPIVPLETSVLLHMKQVIQETDRGQRELNFYQVQIMTNSIRRDGFP